VTNNRKPSGQPAAPSTPRDAEYLWRVKNYRARVSDLYPEIPFQLLQNCSIFPIDALVVGYFLDGFDQQQTVYEIGSFVGVSSYLFATHPKVSELVCVDPNPRIADEALANSEWANRLDLESLEDLRVYDVAREVFASLDKGVLKKVQFREGVVGSTSLGAITERTWQSEKIKVPEVGASGDGLLAYIDGLHTREGVAEDLRAVFERNPNAVAVLDDCRHAWGPFVHAGVVDFLKRSESGNRFRFRLFADLSPGVATSNLGLLYSGEREGDVNAALRNVASKFSQRLDPLNLLIRENDLIAEVNRRMNDIAYLQGINGQLQREKERLQRDNEFLTKTFERRSHQAAEVLANTAQHIPGVRNLIRKER
jgi:hypothetical protein